MTFLPAFGRPSARYFSKKPAAVFAGLLALLGSNLCNAGTPPPSTPFAPRSGPISQTRFVELSPDATGVKTENKYDDPKMWGSLYHEFEIGPIGSGVAVGDYDGDGRPDIFVTSKVEGCRLFRNLGNWKFEDVTRRAGVDDPAGVWKQGTAFADVNNDGRLDLYVCRFGAPNLLYINQGDGTFKESAKAYGLDVADSSVTAAFADYDRDGWLDLYLQTNLLDNSEHPVGQKDYLFHNNGNGTFSNVTAAAALSGETQGNSAVWWDYDNDGWPDLYVANDFAVSDFLLHNNRNGTFTNVINDVVPHMTYSSMGADIGDVNNDGLMDFMVAEMAATTREKDQRTMADTRAKTRDPRERSPDAPPYLRNALYINSGKGRCFEAAYLAGLSATDWTWSVRFEDLDNDGKVDLHITNGMHREIHNTDLLHKMMQAESADERVRIAKNSPVLAEPNLAFKNLGDLEFKEVGAEWGLNQKGVSFGTGFGDFDGDGDLDLVYVNFQKGVTLLRNDNDSGNSVIFDLKGTASNRFGEGATLRLESASGIQIRQLVVSRGYMSSSEPCAHFGLGPDGAVNKLTIEWPSGRRQVLRNLEANRRFVITEPGADSDDPVTPAPRPQFEEKGDRIHASITVSEPVVDEIAQQRLLPGRFNRGGPALAAGDLNGDGVADVLAGGTSLEPARILFGTTERGFSGTAVPLTQAPATVNDGPVLLLDANRDGADDILLTRGGNSQPAGTPDYQPSLYLNRGDGSFAPAPEGTLPEFSESTGAAVAADFNRDGTLDVFLGSRMTPGQYPDAPRSALWANIGGRFVDVTDEKAPALRNVGMVTAALWTDVDGDGWLDLLVALDWGSVRYFHNDSGTGFTDASAAAGFEKAGKGWWTSLSAADFNGDGTPDYAVGNVGLNTQYRASPERPALLFNGDFNRDGTLHLIEAFYEGDRLFPVRSRSALSSSLPFVNRRYPKNDIFARATLEDLFGKETLAASQRLEATELRSGVFLSQPDGTFKFEALPRFAQIAPIQGMVAGDFDGDGFADLYCVQNSYAPNPVVGRFDGGLGIFLRGNGRGSFTPVAPLDSGLLVPGDAKALVTLDQNSDGWPDFLASRNNTPTLFFENQGRPGCHSFRLRLRGPAGNPHSIGARVQLELADGALQTLEIAAGSGYFSQSTPECFFGYKEGNPPKVLRVRWPSGKIAQYTLPPGTPFYELSAPELK